MSKKALFIVEGDREEEYVSKIAEVMEIDVKVYPVKANIYMLYSKLKAEDFQLNIVDTLLEMKGVEDRYKQILREGDAFAYTYLLFDLDIQDNDKPIGDNYKIVREMLEYFIDETDETVGKLYVDYPMIESLWDYDKNDLDEYKTRHVLLSEIKNYKRIVGDRGNPVNLSKYTLEKFIELAVMNIKKANYIINSLWEKPNYDLYLSKLNQLSILDCEEEQSLTIQHVMVLNSIPLFMVDYWGNENGFYDEL